MRRRWRLVLVGAWFLVGCGTTRPSVPPVTAPEIKAWLVGHGLTVARVRPVPAPERERLSDALDLHVAFVDGPTVKGCVLAARGPTDRVDGDIATASITTEQQAHPDLTAPVIVIEQRLRVRVICVIVQDATLRTATHIELEYDESIVRLPLASGTRYHLLSADLTPPDASLRHVRLLAANGTVRYER